MRMFLFLLNKTFILVGEYDFQIHQCSIKGQDRKPCGIGDLATLSLDVCSFLGFFGSSKQPADCLCREETYKEFVGQCKTFDYSVFSW